MLTRVNRFEIDAPVRATAAAYIDPLLRSLDAMHLATADNLVASGKHMSAFVTHGKRLAPRGRRSRFDGRLPRRFVVTIDHTYRS